jgi:hypothetical protein
MHDSGRDGKKGCLIPWMASRHTGPFGRAGVQHSTTAYCADWAHLPDTHNMMVLTLAKKKRSI